MGLDIKLKMSDNNLRLKEQNIVGASLSIIANDNLTE